MRYNGFIMKRRDISTFQRWEDVRKEWFQDPEFKAEWDKLEDEFRLADALIRARLERKLTQTELAQKAGMKQAAIARLEGGESNPRYKTLTRVAKALDKKIALV